MVDTILRPGDTNSIGSVIQLPVYIFIYIYEKTMAYLTHTQRETIFTTLQYERTSKDI